MKVLTAPFLVASLLCAPVLASAVTIPYTENFDDETLGSSAPSEGAPESGQFGVSGGGTGAWSVVEGAIAGDLAFQNAYTATGATSSNATIDFAGTFGGALKNDFSISTEFTLDKFSVTSSNITVGLGALGLNSAFSGSSTSAFYLADVMVNESTAKQDIGRIRIIEVGSGAPALVQTNSGIPINDTDTYRMTLQGKYVGNDLQLSFTFENLTAGTSSSIFTTDTTPINGTYFGYRNRINVSGELDVNFDHFLVTVPEPGSAALLGVGLLGLIGRRRRR